MLGQFQNSFVGFEALKRVDFARCSKNVFWKDCFRWPDGPAETIQYALRNKNALENVQLRSHDALLG